MIGFFPTIYDDELLYSQLCRYYQRSGYTRYLSAADDLFAHRTVRPIFEWVNEYTKDAMGHITKHQNFETVVRDHTMFPAYTRFLPKKRRNDALNSLVSCDGNYYNLVFNQNIGKERYRYMRYCPICAAEDRERYGETYWHREHQIIHLDICPKHKCYLKDSNILLGKKCSPGLYAAEVEVPYDADSEMCLSEQRIRFAQYILDVFRMPVDMETDTPVGSFLRFMLDEKYLSDSKMKVNSTKLYADYCKFIADICEPMSFESFSKVYDNYSLNQNLICQLAFFQGIPVEMLVKPSIAKAKTLMDTLYEDLGTEYGISVETLSEIGDKILSFYNNAGKVTRKSGPKQREWAALDEEYLPKVREIVARLYCSDGKPGRVSIARVERELGVSQKQLEKLPKCRKYVEEHMESRNEYKARRVTWAVRLFLKEGRYISKNKLNHFLGYKRNDIASCVPYITDTTVKNVMREVFGTMTIE